MDSIPANAAVFVSGLTKVYRPRGVMPPQKALDRIDLTIPRGSLFGLLGPNGAGKSTFINILAGLVLKTEGTVRVGDYDIDTHPRYVRASIGVVPQELNMDPFFSPWEILELQAGLYGVPKKQRRTDELLAAVGLTDKARAYSRSLSGGMRRRLMVAKAMVHNPAVLVLDEPTAGVDVELRQALWSYVRQLNRQGTTVILTTHYLEEAESLCDQIAIINHGQVVTCETTSQLLRRLDSKTAVFTLDRDIAALPAGLTQTGLTLSPPRQVTFHYKSTQDSLAPVLSALHSAGLGVVDISTEEASLEDVFLQLTRSPKTTA